MMIKTHPRGHITSLRFFFKYNYKGCQENFDKKNSGVKLNALQFSCSPNSWLI